MGVIIIMFDYSNRTYTTLIECLPNQADFRREDKTFIVKPFQEQLAGLYYAILVHQLLNIWSERGEKDLLLCTCFKRE